MRDGLRDALFIRNILFELGVCKANHSIALFIDNITAKALAETSAALARYERSMFPTKKSASYRGEIKGHYTPGAHRLPDWFTKPVPLPEIISARDRFDLAPFATR